jgi:hypothetical protein
MAADAQTLPDGSPMPKPWARLLGASLEPPKIGQDGVLLGETQILTYAGLFGVTVETDKLKGGDDYFYLQAICRAPTATGEPCGLVQKLTRHGAADIEFGNTMDHLVAKHLVLVNIAHRCSRSPRSTSSAASRRATSSWRWRWRPRRAAALTRRRWTSSSTASATRPSTIAAAAPSTID